MKVYQVGGSVRDKFRGINNPSDIDYVVVGSSVAEMLALGFQQVGTNFPVFLHPITKQEYALARTEIKSGTKHTDFQFFFDKNISLEQDLERRDFRCNAIAFDEQSGKIIDPFNGRADVQNKLLHHINAEHFPEDPLRILRMCRFTAQLDFNIAPETMLLARNMVNSGMLSYLPAERIWKEIEKALNSPDFYKFIEAARDCGALKFLMPNIDKLWDTPEKLQYHPEGNSGEHTLLTLKQARNENPLVKFALLLHDIGKSATPQDILPSHKGHSEAGLPLLDSLCQNLKVPNKFARFARMASKNHMKLREVPQMRLSTILKLIDEAGQNLEDFISVCRCDMLGRLREIGHDEINNFNKIADRLRTIRKISQTINASDMPNYEDLPKDKHFGEVYKNYRLKKIAEALELLN